jgi:lipopolysaccharide export system permease protein
MTVFGRILSRYVFRQAAGALLLILISLTAVVWIAVALRQLELVTNQGQNALRFLTMTTLAIPALLAVIGPIALLIACLHVLNRLAGDSELIVMTGGGMPTLALLKPLGLLAIIVALGVSVVNHSVGPWSQRLLREYTVLVRTDLIGQVLQPWSFKEPESKLTVHIRDRDAAGNLLGLLFHDARDAKQVSTYLAERAQIIKQGESAYLRMENGHILRRQPTEPAPQIIEFKEYVVDVNQLEQRADAVQPSRPRERYTPELLWPDSNDPVYKSAPTRLTAELHERLSSALYPFAFVVLVVAFVGGVQSTRQNRLQAVIGAFSLAVFARTLGITATNAAAVNPSRIYLMYAVPVGAALIGLIAVYRQAVPRPRTPFQRAMDAGVEWFKARFSRIAAARLRRLQHRQTRGGFFVRRTLRRYVAKRFLFSILGAFVVCSCLIYMIDMIELLRMSRRATDLPMATLLWLGVLRLPAFAEILLAFAVLVGSIGALLSLNRKSELTVMRSAGMSAWQFLRPGLAVTLVLGVLAITLFNPLAASARSEAEQLIAEVFGKEAGLLAASGEGAWLRQDGADGQSVLNARASSNQGLSLVGVIAFQFDKQGRFAERADAERAVLQDGYWELHKATVSRPLREPELYETYSLSTHLNRERVGDALGSENAVSFWQLPRLIEASEKAGLSASKYRMQQALLAGRPALLIVMVVLAATVSLRSFRSGGIQTMVLLGMIGGIGFFLLAEISRQVGAAGLLSPALAVGVPIALALLVSLTVLLHQEDG